VILPSSSGNAFCNNGAEFQETRLNDSMVLRNRNNALGHP
jgi:hypothetical protein